MSGRVFLVPNNLTDNREWPVPMHQVEWVKHVKLWVGETPKACMRMISRFNPTPDVECYFPEKQPLDEQEKLELLQRVQGGEDLAVISDAGCPGIADPGSYWVYMAHQMQIPVISLTGPCSFVLALMSSGFQGQKFHFHGYLSRESRELDLQIREMEADIRKNGTTHIFMEAPHRNQTVFERMLRIGKPDTWLHISCNIYQPGAWNRSLTLGAWKYQKVDLHKKEVVFLLGKPVTGN